MRTKSRLLNGNLYIIDVGFTSIHKMVPLQPDWTTVLWTKGHSVEIVECTQGEGKTVGRYSLLSLTGILMEGTQHSLKSVGLKRSIRGVGRGGHAVQWYHWACSCSCLPCEENLDNS